MALLMHQGDQYSIILKVEVNGIPISLVDVELIEFAIGDVVQLYPSEVRYDPENNEFYFPITQEQTFLMEGMQEYQVRVKYTNNNIVGTPVQMIDVNNSISKNII